MTGTTLVPRLVSVGHCRGSGKTRPLSVAGMALVILQPAAVAVPSTHRLARDLAHSIKLHIRRATTSIFLGLRFLWRKTNPDSRYRLRSGLRASMDGIRIL